MIVIMRKVDGENAGGRLRLLGKLQNRDPGCVSEGKSNSNR